MNDRTTLLLPIWTDKCQTATDRKTKAFACAIVPILKIYANNAKYRPSFNPAGIFT